MCCNFVRYFGSTLLMVLGFCAVASAQVDPVVDVKYHIMNPKEGELLPSNTMTDKYYRYLMRDPATPYAPPGLHDDNPYNDLGYVPEVFFYDLDELGQPVIQPYTTSLILYNDDATLQESVFDGNYGFEIGNYSPLTVRSDVEGQKRTITTTNAGLFRIHGLATYITVNGIPLYATQESVLTLTSDIILANSTSAGVGLISFLDTAWIPIEGGVPLQFGGVLNAQGVTFTNNSSTSSGSVIISDYFYEGRISRDVMNLDRARFTGNKSDGGGGAIALSWSDIFADRAEFSSNSAGRIGGGALGLAQNSTAQIQNANFRFNRAGGATSLAPVHGGAVYVQNSDLYAKGTSFVGNSATGYGGAIYVDANDGGGYVLELGAFAGATAQMSDNLQNYGSVNNTGVANSIYLTNTGTQSSRVALNVEVDGAENHFNMNDPLAVGAASNLYIGINKTGTGSWNLYGNNDLSEATLGAHFHIAAGTLRLGNATNLDLANAGGLDSMNVGNGARLAIGTAGVAGTGVTVAGSNLSVAQGGELRLDNDFNLQLTAVSDTTGLSSTGGRNNIAGTISGSGDLVLGGPGKMIFSGSTSGYSGNLLLNAGELVIDSENSFATSGNVTLGRNAVLSVQVNPNVPNIKANAITINDTRININGVYGSTNHYVVLESNRAITGEFDDAHLPGVNMGYLTAGFGFNEDRTKYEGTITLRWDADIPDNDPRDLDNNVFDIDPTTGPDSFTVGVVLEDNTQDGKSLVKRGAGTLVLSEANEYRGDTKVEAGVLKLTDALATGRQGDVAVSQNALLALDFDAADYAQKITGQGRVVKTGEGTLTLANTANDYTGGTLIDDGKLRIENAAVLGTGTIAFGGGTLQVDAGNAGTIISQNIATGDFSDAVFETLSDTQINATISGQGGLRKTGAGKLILSGPAAYQGETKIEEGIFAVGNINALGQGRLVLSDGVTLENNAGLDGSLDIDRNVELALDYNIMDAEGVRLDTQANLKISGDVTGRGRMVKVGENTLTLSGKNTFSGGLELREGVVDFSQADNLGSGGLRFDGGTLRNTATVNNLNAAMTMVDGESIRLDTVKNLTILSNLTGRGGLTKTGEATLTLAGNSDYRGETRVIDGLLQVEGMTRSKTIVGSGAALTGTGMIDNDVAFESGSAYQWTFGVMEEDSPFLSVQGDIHLDNAIFRPVTSGMIEIFPDVIDGWTALKFAGTLTGDEEFLAIDNALSPFYDFELDYSTPGEINVIGYHRRDPRQLSDLVAMSIVMPQRQVHRRAFEQLDKELQGGRDQGLNSILPRQNTVRNTVRGQHHGDGSRLWAAMTGRNTEYDSKYHTGSPWELNSFGIQVGYSFLSSNWLSLGVTAGVDFPELKNFRDKVEATDGYMGLYYGQRIRGMWELKGYFGGGTQRFKSYRRDAKYEYRTKYHGDSFEASLELGRPVLLGRVQVRPHAGFDFAYASQQGSRENILGTEYRTYSDVSLTQVFFRVGLDMQRAHRHADSFLGISYSNMIAGQSLPCTYVYYPVAQSGTTNYGTDLGRNVITIRGGGNLYLNESRSRSLFLNITGDIFPDRSGGQCEMSTTFGYDVRF